MSTDEILRIKKLIHKEVDKKGRALILWEDLEATWEMDELNNLMQPEAKVVKIEKNNFLELKLEVEINHPNDSYVLYYIVPLNEDIIRPIQSIILNATKFENDSISILSTALDTDEWSLRKLQNEYPKFFENSKRVNKLSTLLKRDNQTIISPEYLIASLPYFKLTVIENIELLLGAGIDHHENKFLQDLQQVGLLDYFITLVNHETGIKIRNDELFLANFQNTLMTSVFLTGGGILIDELKAFESPQKNKLSLWFEQIHDDKMIKQTYNFIKKYQLTTMLKDFSLKQLVNFEYFYEIDEIIVEKMIDLIEHTIQNRDSVLSILSQRLQKNWVINQNDIKLKYEFLNDYLDAEKSLKKNVERLELGFTDLNELYSFYYRSGHLLDLHFRNLSVLNEEIDGEKFRLLFKSLLVKYENSWLEKIAELSTDALRSTSSFNLPKQTEFYAKYIKSQPKSKRQFVIISDALRYEAGYDLSKELKVFSKSKVNCEMAIASIPTFTKLGMASLLPQVGKLSYNSKGDLMLAEMRTKSIADREQILKKANPDSTALKLSEFMALTSDTERGKLIKGKKIVYLYHDWIDAIGDTSKTEIKTYREVRATINELKIAISKLMSSSAIDAKRIIITADHGFNFVTDPARSFMKSQADKSLNHIEGNTRFRVYNNDGHELEQNYEVAVVPEKLNTIKENPVLLAEGLKRFRQGAGTRFFHGGITPQEAVIPIITIDVQNEDNRVDISVIDAQKKIVDYKPKIAVYQNDVIFGEVLPRTVRFSIWHDDYQISNNVIREFDFEKRSDQQQIIEFIIFEEKYQVQSNALLKLETLNQFGKWEHYASYEYVMMILGI